MHSTLMIRQILEANKKVFEESLSAMVAFQEHAEKIMHIFWEKSAFFPAENKKVMDDWVDHYKNSLDDFKTNVDKRFKLMEDYLLNTADQVESSMHTVVEKTIPVSQASEVTKRPTVMGKKEGISVKKTVKKNKVKLDKIK